MGVTDKLQNAITELRGAREEAGLGTSLMIDSVIDDIQAIQSRLERINERDDE